MHNGLSICIIFFSTLEGKEIILKGWKKAGILELVYGSTIIPPDDPFTEN